MLDVIDWNNASPAVRARTLSRPLEGAKARDIAQDIVRNIEARGDEAVFDYAQRLDGWVGEEFLVPQSDLESAFSSLCVDDKLAIEEAIGAVTRFHAAQGYREISVETWPGVNARRVVRPLERVALYIPAGSAPLVSTLIMLGVPAQLAKVDDIICLVPPGPDGKVNSTILATAYMLGLTKVYALGGAHGVAAAGLGKGGLPKVDKIFGPGNAYVAAAKAILSQMPGGAASDLPAGPSEVLVIADDQANPDFVAADLLSQAEHDPIAQVVLVSESRAQISAVIASLKTQLEGLSRQDIARQSLTHARAILVKDMAEAIAVSNLYAPEHLIVQCRAPEGYVDQIRHAGSVFLGALTPEAAGDYAAGPNHALPTSGAARAYGGVSVEMFQKTMSVLSLSPQGTQTLGPIVERLADLEGLDAHREAMRLRRVAMEEGM